MKRLLIVAGVMLAMLGVAVPAAAAVSVLGIASDGSEVPPSLSPTAYAGSDQVVAPGTIVSLDGTLSRDPEGTPLFYSWRQLDGPAVTIDSPQSATTSFTSGGGNEVYLIALTVRDSSGEIATDTLVVSTTAVFSPLRAGVLQNLPGQAGELFANTSSLRRSLTIFNIMLFVTAIIVAAVEIVDRLPQRGGLARPVVPGAKDESVKVETLIRRQRFQQLIHSLSWPIFIGGASLNTVLVLWSLSRSYLVVEVCYVALVVFKVLLESRLTHSSGLVRDAITHVPLDLAVVRLYDQQTGRLVLTRVTDEHGKFYALPPAGIYRVMVSKSGYATSVRDGISVSTTHDGTLRLKVSLMPSVPQGYTRTLRAV